MDLLKKKYIIDGVPMESTPLALLEEISIPSRGDALEAFRYDGPCCEQSGSVFDETLDPDPERPLSLDLPSCLKAVLSSPKTAIPLRFAASASKTRLCSALVDTLWAGGRFLLGDLQPRLQWTWKEGKIGSLAALYLSVEAVARYLDALDIRIGGYSLSEGEPDLLVDFPDLQKRRVPSRIVPDPQSWIVYIPFDSSDFRLGASALYSACGLEDCALAPELNDPDCFMDCYEVLREFSEDGILLSAGTVGRGGLLTALDSLCGAGAGAEVNLSGIRRSLGVEEDMKILFAEVPGALIQIRDSDFDYLDAQMILQDVMYFPIGHPVPSGGITLNPSRKTGLESIMESLSR